MQLSLRQLFLRHQAQTSPAPMALEVVSAEGIYLYGANGEKWMDMISGISVSNVGHRHPHVLKAINQSIGEIHAFDGVRRIYSIAAGVTGTKAVHYFHHSTVCTL
jgi:4-aminobutyrate aminotransferase-like enzyme